METSTDRPSDAELIDSAFAELFDRHAVAVHRYLARRIGPTIADGPPPLTDTWPRCGARTGVSRRRGAESVWCPGWPRS